MKSLLRSSIVLCAAAAISVGAQAQMFTESFDAADGITGANVGLIGNFTSVTLTGAATIANSGGDGWASLVDSTVMNMTFSLASAPTQVSVDFWASVLTTASIHQSKPMLTLTGQNGATQTITGATNVQNNVANPGTNGAGADAGSNYVFTFANPTGPAWGTGVYTLTFSNTPVTAGIRIDDIVVTAVPEPQAMALMLAGLAAVGFVARRRTRA